jgi:hypothetical protein
MKKLLSILVILLAFSCSSKEKDDPLILPPNFAEMPDLNNPEKPKLENNQEDVERLRELLLKSEE